MLSQEDKHHIIPVVAGGAGSIGHCCSTTPSAEQNRCTDRWFSPSTTSSYDYNRAKRSTLMANIITTFDGSVLGQLELLELTDRIRTYLIETLTTTCQLGPGS